MSLGYALVHPVQVEMTSGRNAMKLGFDDGVDVVLAAIGVGDVGAARQAVEDELQDQLDNVVAQFESLLRGPLAGLMHLGDLLDADAMDWAGLAERVSAFLCNLQPAVVQGLLTGVLNQVAGAVPILDPVELVVRGRAIATAALGTLEAPLLSGRDDMEAHRGYRAAAMLRLLLRDLFDRLDVMLGGLDPVGTLRSALEEVPNLDEAIVASARAAGCWVHDNVVPFLRCIDEFDFSASVDLDLDGDGDGPSGMPDFTTKAALLDFDSQPAPHEPKHPLWWLDLATGLIGFAVTIFDLVRTRNPPARFGHFLADLLLPLWIGFRLVARAFRWPFINGPPGGPEEATKFVRFLFSDFGDFCVQLFIHFLGSISDMYAWSNWISSIGLRVLRYFFYVLQPRMVYLFFRGAFYLRDWKDLPAGEQDEAIPMPRVAWLLWGPAALLCFVVGLFFGGLDWGWENFSIRGKGPIGPVVASILAAAVSFAFTPPVVIGQFQAFGPGHITRNQWQSGLVWALILVILLIALLTLFQTSAGLSAVDSPGKVAGWVIAFLVLIGVSVVGPAFVGDWSHGMHWFAIWLLGLIFPGVMLVIAWWFAICDGQDRQDVFEGRDPATSPWALPYPAGESWLCGQGFHGFFSHEKLTGGGRENLLNHYSYDFNEDFGKRVLASRPGVVVKVLDGLADHNVEDANEIELQHLDWVEGHDPGWDQERALTYSAYLHLRHRGAHVSLGQLVHRGRHIADVDDAGVSAMNHLHFSGMTGQNADHGIVTMPVVFRDQGVRGRRSVGMISGKPMSLAFFESENAETTKLSATDVTVTLSTDAGHTHTATFGPADLAADGTIPDPVVLATTTAGTTAHRHQLSLSRAKVEDLLRRRDITGASTTVDGHSHTVEPLPTQPADVQVLLSTVGTSPNDHSHAVTFRPAAIAAGAGGTIPATVTLTSDSDGNPAHTHTLDLTRAQVEGIPPITLSGHTSAAADGHTHELKLTFQFSLSHLSAGFFVFDPPGGQLLARNPGPYDLLGEQMVLRVNGRATEWYSFGAHRPRLPADLTLDRGPASGAVLRIQHGTTTAPVPVGADLMPRAAARELTRLLQAAGASVVVRAQPVLVVETRRRGRDASLTVTATPPGLTSLTPGVNAGTGTLGRLDAVIRQELRDVIVAALAQQPGLPAVTVAGAGDTRTITSGGAALTGFGGSTPRHERVLTAVYSAATKNIDDANPLPLTTGILRLGATGGALDVPISGAPARVAVTDLAAARLSGANLTAEPLTVQVRGDAQPVRFSASDTTPAAVAQRIVSQAEGVRAWAEGTGIVVEAVGAGALVTLVLSKGSGTFPAVTPGASPGLGPAATPVADSTAVSLDELAALVASAQAEAARPNAPATVLLPSGAIRVTATAGGGTPVAVSGPAALMQSLGVAPAPGAATAQITGTDQVELTGLPNSLVLPTGGWLDVTVGADTWRVDLPAEPARVELAADGLPAAGSQLQLTVNGTAVPVGLDAAHTLSPHAVASRIVEVLAAAGHGVTVRVATRLVIESAVHGQGDLTVGGSPSPGSASAGVLVQGRSQAARGSYADSTAIVLPTGGSLRPGRLVRAFDAAISGAQLDVTAADAGPITITPLAGNPFGFTPGPTPGRVTGGPFALAADSVAYEVQAATTTTVVELNAGPARAHSVAGLATVGVPAGATLTVTTTPPGGTATNVTVDLGGVTTLTEAADRIQRDAVDARAWTVGSGRRIDVETRGGGTGWRLRLAGERALVALGFDAARIDAIGGIDVVGTGNVPDGAAVTLSDIRDVFSTMGGLATFDEAGRFTVSGATGKVEIEGRGGAPALRSEPAGLASVVAATVTGNKLTSAAGPFRLDSGWLVVDVGGNVAASGAVWGRRAWLEAPDPLPATPAADLGALVSATVKVAVDGSPPVAVTLPAAAFPTVEALLGHLNRAAGVAGRVWFGVVRRGSDRHIRVESRRRGSGSDIGLEMPPSATPRFGFPGGATAATVPGGGSVADMTRVTAAEVATALDAGRGFGAVPQQTVDVVVAGTDLRLTARGGFRTTLTAGPLLPGASPPVHPPGRTDVLTVPYATPLDTGPHHTILFTNDATTGPNVTRLVSALLRTEPARLGPMALPARLRTLNTRTLRLTAMGTAFTVTFTGVTSEADVVDQIERAGEGLVRASVLPVGGAPPAAALVVETIAEGSSGVTLGIDVGASTAIGVLGAPPAAASTGAGDAANVRAVTAAEYRAVLLAGRLGPPIPAGPDQTTSSSVAIGAVSHLRIKSDRLGCRSTVELVPLAPPADRNFAKQLAAGPVGLRLDRSMGWGPAARASVALPPLAGSVALNGELWINLNDNGPAIDVAPAVDVRVPLAGTFDARGLADAIDAALAGVGSAAAFPDGVVVVESMAPGLTGRVRVPSATKVSTPAVLTALGLSSAAPLVARGWPGAGIPRGHAGFRGLTGNARADADWDFRFPGGPITLTVTSGQTPAQAAAALDPLLRGASGNRMGVALVGEDGALYVEFFGQVPGQVTMDPKANYVQPDQPGDVVIWEGGDAKIEPAFELRPTWELRTFRAVFFDRRGDDEVFLDPALFAPGSERVFDLGWVRPPSAPKPAAGGGPSVGTVGGVQRWAPGRWLFAARAAGARSDTFSGDNRARAYSPAGAMIVSGGTATIAGETVHFAHRARYWVWHGPLQTNPRIGHLVGAVSAPLRVVKFGEEFLVDHLVVPG